MCDAYQLHRAGMQSTDCLFDTSLHMNPPLYTHTCTWWVPDTGGLTAASMIVRGVAVTGKAAGATGPMGASRSHSSVTLVGALALTRAVMV